MISHLRILPIFVSSAMASLAVPAPLNYCKNTSDELRCRYSKDFSLKPYLAGLSSKKSVVPNQHKQQQQQQLLVSASLSGFPRKDASPNSRKSSIILTPSPQDMLAGGPDYYQPFRPPPTVTLENVSTEDQIQIVRERRGRWFEYAIHVAALLNAGFTPSMLDEITGISGVEQNKIVVASQVRSSLEESGMNVEALSYFNVGGGADLLYELRILTAEQRLSAALYALDHRMDSKGYRDLARSMKDFGRRKNDDGWESFTSSPGDSLAYSYFRLSKEVKDEDLRETILKRGIEYAETEKAQARMRAFLESGEDDSDDQSQISVFEILRMSMSEAGTSSTPYMLPVVEPNVSDFDAVPSVSKKGPFGIQHAEHGWKTWVSLPAWDPLKTAVAPVAVSCPNAALLPWKQKRKELNEPVIILADKDVKDIFEAAYYVVDDGEGRFALQNGAVVSEAGSRVLGKVFLALRPPAPEVDEIASIEWD